MPAVVNDNSRRRQGCNPLPAPECRATPVASASPSELLPPKAVWSAVVLLLIMLGPLFVCMPLNSDTALFDVQASVMLNGGVLYRDIVEPNLPGIVWLHSAIRSVAGWSFEAMNAADLLIVAGILCLCCALLRQSKFRRQPIAASLFVLLAMLFYLSTNEWCHAQRDTWMLLPALAAVWLRSTSAPGSRAIRQAVLEGICWGAAFWIKPHVAIPAIAVIAADLFRRSSLPSALKEIVAVIAGGILVALPGVVWLVSTGTWHHFQDMMLNWNPEYLAAGASRKDLNRWLMMVERFRPWWIVHLVAIPLAIGSLRAGSGTSNSAGKRSQRLMSAAYIGWLAQSFGLQHAMDYIHVPALLLGMVVIAGWNWQLDVSLRRTAVCAFLLLAMLSSPMLRPQRLANWTRCWTEGSTPQIRASLAHGNFPDWEHLSDVVRFLKSQHVQDGQLTCANVHSVHLYNELRIRPATRYWTMTILRELFPSRVDLIDNTLRCSDQRFLVVEEREQSLASDEVPPSYDTTLPVVFRSGTYTVLDTHPQRIAHAR
ncbi:MAG: hypothetical protein R3C19_18490 [Planctomycetaceae bacterium]